MSEGPFYHRAKAAVRMRMELFEAAVRMRVEKPALESAALNLSSD